MPKKLPESVPLPEESSMRLNLRLTPSEYEILLKLTAKKKCNLSQAAKLLMFNFKKKELKEVFASGLEDSELLKISEEKSREFADAVKTISRYIERFDQRISASADNEPLIQSDLEYANKTLRSIETMCACLTDIAKRIETAVYEELASRKDSGTPPSVIIVPPKNTQGDMSPAGNRDTEKDKIPYKFQYMQTLEIIGKVAGSPETFTNKKGKEMLRFTVTVLNDTKDSDASNSTAYTVFFQKTGVAPYLKDGKRVFAKGEFRFSGKGEGEGPDLKILADDVILL